MDNLNKKRKVIILILIVLIVIIGAYIYLKNQNGEEESNETNFNEMITNNEEITNNVKVAEKEDTQKKNKIIIHISGEIKNKGIIELEEGARIDDAIKKAGGVTENANLDNVNLAYMLEDGIKIYIPSKKESMENKEYITRESGNNVVVKENKENNTTPKHVNINTATKKDLEELPGIGSEMAERIVEHREKNGKFSKIEDLQKVKGIGESKFAKIKEFITIK